MDIATLRSMSVKELHAELDKQQRAQFGLQQGLRAGEVKDHHLCKQAKKTIARIQTLISEKTQNGQPVE